MLRRLLITLTLLFSLGLTSSVWASAVQGDAVAEIIRETFSDDPRVAEAMIVIANCESRGLVHRLEDGRYLPNTQGSGAKGALQLTVWTHQQESDRLGLGLDLSTDEGYFDYVRHLVTKRGFRDWRWSQSCWRNGVHEIMNGDDPRSLLS